LPRPAACFLAITCATALVCLAISWIGHGIDHPVEFVCAALLALICGARRVRVSREGTISTGFVIVFASVIRLGLPEACLVAAASGLGLTLLTPERSRNRLVVVVFALASLAVTAWAASEAFALSGGSARGTTVWELGVPALLAVVVYSVVNCAFVSVMGALAASSAVWPVFAGHVRTSAVTYLAGAGWGVLVHLALLLSGVWVIIAGMPLLYSLHIALGQCALAEPQRPAPPKTSE